MNGSIFGEGVEEILKMKKGERVMIQDLYIQLTRDSVPVVVAFTKFDQAVAVEGGKSARTNARARIEQSCHSLLHRESRDVPAEIVSGSRSDICGMTLSWLYLFTVRRGSSDLIDNLVATTDRLMTGSRATSIPAERWRAQGAKPRIAPAPLVWSAALRINRDIFIQASIEYVAFLPDLNSIIYNICSPESGEAASTTTLLTQANSNTDVLN